MDLRSFARAYARSPLGIGSLLSSIAVAAASAMAGLPLPAALLAGLASLAVFMALALATGFAQRAAVSESDRDSLASARARLAEAAAARSRLAALRLADTDVASARDLLVLEAGRFVEDCGRAGTYDPEGVEAILGSLGLVDAWLREADESAVERRFGLADAHPFPEAAKRAAEALRERAALVSERRIAATGEVPGADRMAIEEELK